MGTSGNDVIHKNLVQLKNRLIKNASISKNISELDKLNEELSVENLKNVWNLYYNGGNNWSKQIDKYISWCSGGLLNSFDRRSNREINHVVTPVVEEPVPVIQPSAIFKLVGAETKLGVELLLFAFCVVPACVVIAEAKFAYVVWATALMSAILVPLVL